jgi:hypothetical protein
MKIITASKIILNHHVIEASPSLFPPDTAVQCMNNFNIRYLICYPIQHITRG